MELFWILMIIEVTKTATERDQNIVIILRLWKRKTSLKHSYAKFTIQKMKVQKAAKYPSLAAHNGVNNSSSITGRFENSSGRSLLSNAALNHGDDSDARNQGDGQKRKNVSAFTRGIKNEDEKSTEKGDGGIGNAQNNCGTANIVHLGRPHSSRSSSNWTQWRSGRGDR